MKTITKKMQESLSPLDSIKILKEGNKRFIDNLKINRNLLQQANETSDGQHPFAVVLSCIDSRTSVELIFDQGLGDVFSIRIAGNIINDDILGSMEFGCKLAGSKVIVVLGHTNCGAIKGACDGAELGKLTGLLNKIKPSINDEVSISENRCSSNVNFVNNVTCNNIKKMTSFVLEQSTILKEMVDAGEIGIIGALHEINTGVVSFYDDTLIYKNV